MKILVRLVLGILVALIVILGGGYLYITSSMPAVDTSPAKLEVQMTPENIARGEYLATTVSGCLDCHAQRDFSLFAGPVKKGTVGAGGDVFDHSIGAPGVFYAKNITPYNLQDWTDGEIYRAITVGVDKEGEPICPMVPYTRYAQMDPADVEAIIA